MARQLRIIDEVGSYVIPYIQNRPIIPEEPIGHIIGAIGDSLTEGYFSRAFLLDRLENLTAKDFPSECVSRDGRNFPQYSPTTDIHCPGINAFQSWMPRLNDLLSAAWHKPVFIANEGWGGYNAATYLKKMTDTNWQQRMKQLSPDIWLIHLGVNDGRALMQSAEFYRNLKTISELLLNEYQAEPQQIFIAYPSYDYFPGASEILQSYIVEIDRLISEKDLRHGPDFFQFFAKNQTLYYGADPCHPRAEKMDVMAELWAEVLQNDPDLSVNRNEL